MADAAHAALARGLFADGVEALASHAPEADAETRALLESLGYVAQYHALVGSGARPVVPRSARTS
jgi:hypothetical protein